MKHYIISDEFLIRTPRKSFNDLKAFYNEDVETLFSLVDIQDSIRIASLDLYEKLQRFSILESKERERVKFAFLRYLSRMSTRCTPFGLFAGCAVGSIGKYTGLTMLQKNIRHTRLDMDYLCLLSQYLSNIPEIKCKLKYYANNTIYLVGGEYRYIEYNYIRNKRVYRLSSAKKTLYLKKILSASKKGILIEDIYPFLANEDILESECVDYINDLIQAQILVSELEPSVIGEDFFTRILFILNKIDFNGKYANVLLSIQDILTQIDILEYDSISGYKKIENIVENFGAPFDNKRLFQVDLNNLFVNDTIGVSIIQEIKFVLSFLNKIKPVYEKRNLLKFREKFVSRFEEKEVPLLIALDPEVGIGYPVDGYLDVSPLLDDFKFPDNIKVSKNVDCDPVASVLLKKISEQNDLLLEIEINDDDFKGMEENWNDLPNTFSVFFEIIKDDASDILIRVKSVGNVSAANLFTRFAYANKKIEDLVNKITKTEQLLSDDVLLAEIVHLPDSRIGNVLYRPHLRDYEIAYLANTSKSYDKIIYASDIMISVKNGRLFLRSKRLNKEIIPYLTNSHNYSLSTIPVYRFLCDIQCQNKRTSLTFDIGFLSNELSFIPRVRYRHTVLSLATWNINADEIKYLISIHDDDDFLRNLNLWRVRKKIPVYSLLSDFDNDLFVDWSNLASLRAFLSIVKNRTHICLTEFMYNEKDAVVRDKYGNGYLNECVVSLLKNK